VGERARIGAAVGLILSAALAAANYLGWKAAALPFPPFDLFDWLTRELPGPVVAFGIDAAVVVLRLFHAGSTAAAAKSGEQAAAVVVFVAAGGAIGAIFFALLHFSNEPSIAPGAILGAVAGGIMLVVERTLHRAGSGADLAAAWVLATFAATGVALGWAYQSSVVSRQSSVISRQSSVGGRREFVVRLAGIAGLPALVIGVFGATIGRRRVAVGARWSDNHVLPNADSRVVPVPGTRAEFTPLEDHYRIDVDTRAPAIDADMWRLTIGGMVERPREFTLDDLRREQPLHQFVTLACISNPLGGDLIGTTRWSGVSLRRLIARVQAQGGATHLKVRSADGFFEVISLATIQADARVMLAYAWDDVPLPLEHGFPLRTYVPDVYGMKQPKWVEAIELVNHWEPGFWVARGWDRDGTMAATSVVDAAKGNSVGGMAHAGARGISRVEVRVDAGEWREAELREPLSETTWTIWRADLHASRGEHAIAVRCFDGRGVVQAEPFHTKRVTLGD
jgi:DMSO/TMAO reductase YedYZ molybdopterin-dependent catalytic subunit